MSVVRADALLLALQQRCWLVSCSDCLDEGVRSGFQHRTAACCCAASRLLRCHGWDGARGLLLSDFVRVRSSHACESAAASVCVSQHENFLCTLHPCAELGHGAAVWRHQSSKTCVDTQGSSVRSTQYVVRST
jgi:hypothetical protein